MPVNKSDEWCMEPNKEPEDPPFPCSVCGEANTVFMEDEVCMGCDEDCFGEGS